MSAKYALNLTFFRIWRGSFHFDSIKCIQVYSGWYRSNVNCSPTDSLFTFTYFLSRKSWENKIWLDCSSCVSPRARRGHCLTVAKLQSCCLVSFSHFTVWHQLIVKRLGLGLGLGTGNRKSRIENLNSPSADSKMPGATHPPPPPNFYPWRSTLTTKCL